MLENYLLVFFLVLLPAQQLVLAQQEQPSVVWDEASKSWVSASTALPPQQQQQQQQPTYTQPPQTTTTYPVQPQQQAIIQPIPTSAPAAMVDLSTLATVITPIIGAIAGIFIKNRKDMEKKDEEVKKDTIKTIEDVITPKLKQIAPVAEQTAKQSVQLNQLAEELYKIMADKANEIKDKPEIQQQTLIEDAVKSKIIAQQATAPSMVWDEASKSWISK